jgi:flagellar biogenesis protein FliO
MRALFATVAFLGLAVGALAAPSGDGSTASESLPLGVPKQIPRPDGSSTPAAATGSVGDWARTAAALAGVLVLVVGAGWVVRSAARRGGGGLLGALGAGGRAPSGLLEVLGRYPVGRGSTLVLLKLDRRILLVCQNTSRVSGGSMTTLSEIVDPEDVASILLKSRDAEGETMSRRFQSLLSREDKAMEEVERQPLAPADRTASAPKPAPTNNIRGRLQNLKGRRPLEARA